MNMRPRISQNRHVDTIARQSRSQSARQTTYDGRESVGALLGHLVEVFVMCAQRHDKATGETCIVVETHIARAYDPEGCPQ